jgi:hypothetical protein
MVKSFIWAGIVVLGIGIVVGATFVVPHIGESATTSLNGSTTTPLSPLAVLVTALGLAVGSTLVGIGVGRWKHPRHIASRHGAEI